jgi:outer membrane protein TolC
MVTYQKAVRTALTEVSDSLIDYSKLREQRAEQELLVDARERSVRLSQLRYRGGLDSYLQVLDAETRLFDGQLQLADLKRAELTVIVRLYRALGGGWSPVVATNGAAGCGGPLMARQETIDIFIRTYGYPALFGAMVVEQVVPPMAPACRP